MSSSASNLDDEVRHIDEMNQMFQAQSDAQNALIQEMNNADAAAAAQWQNDLINATAPVGPQ